MCIHNVFYYPIFTFVKLDILGIYSVLCALCVCVCECVCVCVCVCVGRSAWVWVGM